MTKDRAKDIRFVATLLGVTVIALAVMHVKAAVTKPDALNSQLWIEVVNSDPSGENAIMDAEDIYKLYNESLALIEMSK